MRAHTHTRTGTHKHTLFSALLDCDAANSLYAASYLLFTYHHSEYYCNLTWPPHHHLYHLSLYFFYVALFFIGVYHCILLFCYFMIPYGMMPYDTMWYDTIWYNTIWYDSIHIDMIQYDTIQAVMHSFHQKLYLSKPRVLHSSTKHGNGVS